MPTETEESCEERFGYSMSAFKRGNAFLFIFLCVSAVGYFLPALLLVDFNYWEAILVTVGGSLVFAAISALVRQLDFRKMRRMELSINDERIIRQVGDKKVSFPIREISEVMVRESVDGVPCFILLRVPDRRPLRLCGFEDMTRVLASLTRRIAGKATVLKRRSRYNWQHPVVPVIEALAGAFCFLVYVVVTVYLI